MSAYSTLILAASPNAYWRLGEPSGSIANSEVNNGTMVGVYQGSVTLATTGCIAGDADTAVRFTASAANQYVVATGSAHQTLQNVADVFTIEAWVKRATVGTANRQIIFDNGPGSMQFRFDATTDLLTCEQANTSVFVSSTLAISDTNIHHVVATKNGATSANLYIDGVDRTGSFTNVTFTNSTGPWTIGVSNLVNNFFDGTIDEVALYPTALSAATVLSHYQAGTTPGKTGFGAIG